jgi:hypothetical protein
MERNLNSTTHQSGRSIREVSLVAREARRLVGPRGEQARGFGRSYRSWTRINDRPGRGTERTQAVVRRAVLMPAA